MIWKVKCWGMTSYLSLACLYKTRWSVQSLLTATSPSSSWIKGYIFLQVLWVLSHSPTSLKSMKTLYMAGWPVTCLINIWKISLHCLFVFTCAWWMPFLKSYFADGSFPVQLQVFYYQSKSVKYLFKKPKKPPQHPPPSYWMAKCHHSSYVVEIPYLCTEVPVQASVNMFK